MATQVYKTRTSNVNNMSTGRLNITQRDNGKYEVVVGGEYVGTFKNEREAVTARNATRRRFGMKPARN